MGAKNAISTCLFLNIQKDYLLAPLIRQQKISNAITP